MANALRELLLAIRVKVDKTAVAQTDAAFDHAVKSASAFETKASSALAVLKQIGAQLSANQKVAQAFGMRSASHPAPPRPNAPSMAAPDITAFTDQRTGPQKALDSLKEKANSALGSAGRAVDSFNKKFDGIASTIFNARTAVAGFAVVVAAQAVGRFVGEIVEAGGALHDMSQRARVSVETLQVWRSIAADAGADAGAVESAFRKLSKSMAGAARGSKLQAASFKELGVEFQNADGSLRSTEDVLIDTGAALAGMEDDAKATAIATQLLGPAGAALVPAFNQGADAVRKLSVELKENVALNAAEAARLDDVGDALARGTKKWAAIKMRIGVMMLPVLEAVSNGYEKVSKWALRMVKETKVLQTAVIGLVSMGLTRGAFALGGWVVKAYKAGEALKLFRAGLSSATSFALRFVAPLLVIEDFLTFLSGGKSLFGEAMNEVFGEGGAKKAREGILAAFSEIATFVNETLAPAFRGLVDNDLFKGTAKTALDLVLGALNAIGFALSTNTEKANELAKALSQRWGIGPSADERDNALKEGLPGNRKEASGPAQFARKVVTGIFGDPLADPKVRANAEENRAKFEANRKMIENVIPPPTVPRPSGATSNINLIDQRKLEVNVGPNATPGATGRAVAGAVSVELVKDKRQTYQAISG